MRSQVTNLTDQCLREPVKPTILLSVNWLIGHAAFTAIVEPLFGVRPNKMTARPGKRQSEPHDFACLPLMLRW